MEPKPINMTVVIDDESNECLYVEGKIWDGSGEITVFVTDLVSHAKGRPIMLQHVYVLDRDMDQCWPDNLTDALKWVRTDELAASQPA